jgi:hypothetical protein
MDGPQDLTGQIGGTEHENHDPAAVGEAMEGCEDSKRPPTLDLSNSVRLSAV